MLSIKLLGILIGQIVFGIMGDKFGTKKIYGIELIIIVVTTIASSLSAPTVSGISIFGVLSIWRLILGFGIGGDYPLSGKPLNVELVIYL
jgi:PHS family inorganic phosphate transporter-like MFS transporter